MRAVLRAAIGAAAIAVCASFAVATAQDAPSKTLLPGKGAELTMAKCALCHDITHVTRTRLTRDEWDDNIRVMIARGMPIEPAEIAVVLDYLSTYYNRDKPPPAADAAPAAAGRTVDALLSANGCTACHQLDKRVVGPAFREVAAKYKGDAEAASRIARKVKEGGAGAWGPVPMPPHPQLSDEDLTRIAAWVLQQ